VVVVVGDATVVVVVGATVVVVVGATVVVVVGATVVVVVGATVVVVVGATVVVVVGATGAIVVGGALVVVRRGAVEVVVAGAVVVVVDRVVVGPEVVSRTEDVVVAEPSSNGSRVRAAVSTVVVVSRSGLAAGSAVTGSGPNWPVIARAVPPITSKATIIARIVADRVLRPFHIVS
jgi:hypothetical protein